MACFKHPLNLKVASIVKLPIGRHAPCSKYCSIANFGSGSHTTLAQCNSQNIEHDNHLAAAAFEHGCELLTYMTWSLARSLMDCSY